MPNEEFVDSVPSLFTVRPEKNGSDKMITVRLSKGRESASHLIRTTIGVSRLAQLIGSPKSNLSSFLAGHATLAVDKRDKLNRALKKLYRLRVAGQI